MAIINEPYKYSDPELLTVLEITKKKDLIPEHWNDETLENLKLKVKKFYRKKQGGKCCYCGYPLPVHPRGFDLEHIISRYQAVFYMLWPKNLAACCVDCNHAKGASLVVKKTSLRKKTYPDWQEIDIVHPHFDDYEEYISVIGGLFLGLQSKGANTIALCNLTRYHNSALRKLAEDDSEDQYLSLLELRVKSTKNEEKALLDSLIALHSKGRSVSLEAMLAAF